MREFKGYVHGVDLGGWFSQCDHSKERYDNFIATAKEKFNAKYGHEPEVINVIISDGAHKELD